MPQLVDLAPELLDEIFEGAASEDQSRIYYGGLCRAIRFSAQRAHFRRVVLSSHCLARELSRFADLLTASPGTAQHIRVLHVDGVYVTCANDGLEEEWARLLPLLPHLHELQLPPILSAALVVPLSPLSEPSPVPLLHTLSLRGPSAGSMNPFELPLFSHLGRFPSLRTLCFHIGDATTCYSDVRICMSETDRASWRLGAITRLNLKYVGNSFRLPNLFASQIALVRHCTGLTSLTLSDRIASEQLLSILEAVPNPALLRGATLKIRGDIAANALGKTLMRFPKMFWLMLWKPRQPDWAISCLFSLPTLRHLVFLGDESDILNHTFPSFEAVEELLLNPRHCAALVALHLPNLQGHFGFLHAKPSRGKFARERERWQKQLNRLSALAEARGVQLKGKFGERVEEQKKRLSLGE